MDKPADRSMDKPPRQVGFVLGLFGFVFPASIYINFHNPLLIQNLRSFGHSVNWVCFGFVLALYWL